MRSLIVAAVLATCVLGQDVAMLKRVSEGSCQRACGTCLLAGQLASVYGIVGVTVVHRSTNHTICDAAHVANATSWVSGAGLNVSVKTPIGPVSFVAVSESSNTVFHVQFVYDCRSLHVFAPQKGSEISVHIVCLQDNGNSTSVQKSPGSGPVDVTVIGDCVAGFTVNTSIHHSCRCPLLGSLVWQGCVMRTPHTDECYHTATPATRRPPSAGRGCQRVMLAYFVMSFAAGMLTALLVAAAWTCLQCALRWARYARGTSAYARMEDDGIDA